MVRLQEFYRDPRAPGAHDVLPAAFAAVRNEAGAVLVVRRIDDGNWELPGGRVEVGETVSQAVVREVAEEAGVVIELTGISGIYSDPSHVLVDPDGSVHQQLALCFHAVPAPANGLVQPRPDGFETDGASWCDMDAVAGLEMHPAMRLRLATPSTSRNASTSTDAQDQSWLGAAASPGASGLTIASTANAPAAAPACARPPHRAPTRGRPGRHPRAPTDRLPRSTRRQPPGTSDQRALPSDPTFPLGAVRPD